MRRKFIKVRRHTYYPFSLRVRRFFLNFKDKMTRMPKTKRLTMTGSVCGAVVVVVLLFSFGVFGNMPAFNSNTNAANADDTLLANDASAMAEAAPTPAPTPEPTPEPTPDPTLKEGMEGPEIQTLQQRLMDLGYLDIDETTQYYGPATAGAIAFFQRQHGIEQDGVCGPKTLAIIYTDDAKPYTLLEGTEGDDVTVLQERLQELGYISSVTGYYGTETIDAVKRFQERNGLGVDGKTGEMTLGLIYSADAKPTAEMAAAIQRKGNIDKFISVAEEQLGEPYIWGASGPDSFDCSGLVTYCLRQAGSSTGRLNAAGFSQNSSWEKISFDDLQRGDLIFYSNNAGTRVGHVGIVVGDGMMIDASSSNGKVVHRSYDTSYWRNHFVCGRRPW
ncbi:peptidoglycan-binding protein [Christensenella massiliensis]|uniref:Peptidoglycan-binding protein n=1 Tax=Christensenella massiliensis TaxID=1805714 RepID=A0AAU8AAC5_9FIRM